VALEIVDTDGVEALSMRHLAHALSREAMSLYRYAPTKAALLDGVTELVFSQLAVDPFAADWDGELHRVATRFRGLALAHPHVAPLLVTRSLITPLGRRPTALLRPVEDLLSLLTRAGFTPAEAVHAVRLFSAFLLGHVLTELQQLTDNPEETTDLLRLGLHRLPPGEFPQLRSLAPVLADDPEADLTTGVDLLLAHLRSRLSQASEPG